MTKEIFMKHCSEKIISEGRIDNTIIYIQTGEMTIIKPFKLCKTVYEVIPKIRELYNSGEYEEIHVIHRADKMNFNRFLLNTFSIIKGKLEVGIIIHKGRKIERIEFLARPVEYTKRKTLKSSGRVRYD